MCAHRWHSVCCVLASFRFHSQDAICCTTQIHEMEKRKSQPRKNLFPAVFWTHKMRDRKRKDEKVLNCVFVPFPSKWRQFRVLSPHFFYSVCMCDTHYQTQTHGMAHFQSSERRRKNYLKYKVLSHNRKPLCRTENNNNIKWLLFRCANDKKKHFFRSRAPRLQRHANAGKTLQGYG